MHANSIAYMNYLETKRSNLARETETERDNRARLSETQRHNLSDEGIRSRTNDINDAHYRRQDKTARLGLLETKSNNQRVWAESVRSNLASEGIKERDSQRQSADRRYATDVGSQDKRYASDMSYAASVKVAGINAASAQKVARINQQTAYYTADRNFAGTIFSTTARNYSQEQISDSEIGSRERMQDDAQSFTAAENQKGRDFSSSEAKKQRNWQGQQNYYERENDTKNTVINAAGKVVGSVLSGKSEIGNAIGAALLRKVIFK